MEKLTARMELKMKEDTFAGLREIHDKHKITPAELCRALTELAVDYFRKNGRIGFPLTLSETPLKPTSPATIDAPVISMKPNKNDVKPIDNPRAQKHIITEDAESSVTPNGLFLQPHKGARYKLPSTKAAKGRKKSSGPIKP